MATKLTKAQSLLLQDIRDGRVLWSPYSNGNNAHAYYAGAALNAPRPSIVVVRKLHAMGLITLPGRMHSDRAIKAVEA